MIAIPPKEASAAHAPWLMMRRGPTRHSRQELALRSDQARSGSQKTRSERTRSDGRGAGGLVRGRPRTGSTRLAPNRLMRSCRS